MTIPEFILIWAACVAVILAIFWAGARGDVE